MAELTKAQLKRKVAKLEREIEKLKQNDEPPKAVTKAIDTINKFLRDTPKRYAFWFDWGDRQIALVKLGGPERTVVYPKMEVK